MRLREQIFSIVEKAMFNNFPNAYRSLYKQYKFRAEADERYIFNKFVFPGHVVADVGSNIGIYTEEFSRIIGPSGVVHAFEPEARNHALLVRAVAARPNVKINRNAVGARSETIRLHVSANLNVDHRTYATGEDRDTVPVECVALDDYFAPGARVDFIKIDIQGFEYQALQGMSRLLDDNRDVKILFEYFPEGLRANGVEPSDIRKFLTAKGFRLFTVDGEGEHPLDKREPAVDHTGYTNLFAMR